jgi:(2Fe-2S) ferredoxin
VVVVHPDDVWYRQVDPPVAARIVAEHLVAGHPLTDHRVDRARHGG